eukprot:498206-Amphidinium_carterae.1
MPAQEQEQGSVHSTMNLFLSRQVARRKKCQRQSFPLELVRPLSPDVIPDLLLLRIGMWGIGEASEFVQSWCESTFSVIA